MVITWVEFVTAQSQTWLNTLITFCCSTDIHFRPNYPRIPVPIPNILIRMRNYTILVCLYTYHQLHTECPSATNNILLSINRDVGQFNRLARGHWSAVCSQSLFIREAKRTDERPAASDIHFRLTGLFISSVDDYVRPPDARRTHQAQLMRKVLMVSTYASTYICRCVCCDNAAKPIGGRISSASLLFASVYLTIRYTTFIWTFGRLMSSTYFAAVERIVKKHSF